MTVSAHQPAHARHPPSLLPMPTQMIVDALALPAYDLGPEHPFARTRQEPLFDLLDRLGWLGTDELHQAPPATDAELGLAHDAAYIDFCERLATGHPDDPDLRREAPRYGLGTADNPIAPGQHAGAAAAAGGTLACVRRVLDPTDRTLRAFNPTGGLHHAMPAAASGFCIYNDLVIGIRAAQADPAIDRVAYLDFDVHHGDGVELAFRDDPAVLTVSCHETPEVRWPYTGRVTDVGHGAARGSIANLPFVSSTCDGSWQECTAAVLREKLAAFQPDLLVTQHGADPHFEDPLAELCLTTGSFAFAAELARELADEHCGGRWVATGGGGYQPVRVLPRAWAILWATMSDRPIPEQVDRGWLEHWQSASPTPLAACFVDPPFDHPGRAATERANRQTLARFLEAHSR